MKVTCVIAAILISVVLSTRFHYSSKPFHPPRNFIFPKRIIGKRARYCQRSWFDNFEFLHYDTSKDAVYVTRVC